MSKKSEVPPSERYYRAAAARFSIANTELDGGSVSPETREILGRWTRGKIDNESMIAEIKSKMPAPKWSLFG